MAVHRIGIVKNKKANASAEARGCAVAGKRQRGEGAHPKGIIRDDFTMEGYEILELMCELLAERAFDCPYDMHEVLCTFIWSASRMDIPELREVKKQLTKKYGQDFEAAAVRNMDGCVNERVIQKLSVQQGCAVSILRFGMVFLGEYRK
ncbi:hypothetical protein PsorP6_008206 [Peronosclerospora sorghi]|uniref:Uncharacterized protein n=1 Tax=Peronosclerospora sorghi TaxID=230839 RepID=A0ACC0WAM6_9STRA|nr:hypothetical protein PsorP6_008206 [Peronosclerospora sorghi]